MKTPLRLESAGPESSAGFTLLELLTVITIGGLLMTAAVSGMFGLARAQQQSATSESLLSTMRAAQANAQAEGRAYCVRFDTTTTWSTWRYSCDPAEVTTPSSPLQVNNGKTDGTAYLANVAVAASVVSGLARSCPSAPVLGCAFFYPRGIASSGSVQVKRPSSGSTYTLNIVGITGRVFVTH